MNWNAKVKAAFLRLPNEVHEADWDYFEDYRSTGNDVSYSPDKTRWAYIDRGAKKQKVVIDEVSGKAYDYVENVVFSPDSKHVAYIARVGDKELVVFDGKEQKKYDGIANMCFSPDSKQLIYEAVEGEMHFEVINGKEGKKYPNHKQDFCCQPATGSNTDFKLFAHIDSEEGKEPFVVLDGREHMECDYIIRLIFSADGKKFAYLAKQKGKLFVVLNGIPGEKYDNIKSNSLMFDDVTGKLAYVVMEGGKEFVVANGEAGHRYERIIPGSLVFSPDGQFLAYGALENGKVFAVVDGQPGKKYKYELRKHKNHVWLNDIHPIFSSDGSGVDYVIVRGNKLIRVREKFL